MKQEEFNSQWASIVAKAWTDENFKQELVANPEKVLREYGISTTKTPKVVENTHDTFYLVLPQEPEDSSLSQAELQNIAAGQALLCATDI